MNQLTALAWKEWRETRAYLWIALGVFVGLPAIAGLEAMIQLSRHFEISTVPWVLTFGGFLAVFVAVGSTCRDFSAHIEDFWRSRPIGVVRWLLVKYVVGLLVVLVSCAIPLAVDFYFNAHHDTVPVPWLWFIPELFVLLLMLAPMFSVSFLVGCLVRRTAHAAMLALAAVLLVICVPLLFPSLRWLSMPEGFDENVVIYYALGMIAISLISLILALIIARFNWRVESGRKLLYWTFALAILILFGSAAFQLGTNLPVLSQVPMPPGQEVEQIQFSGNSGWLTTRGVGGTLILGSYLPFEVTTSEIKLITGQDNKWRSPTGTFEVPAPGHPEVAYQVEEYPDQAGAFDICNLLIHQPGQQFATVMTVWRTPQPSYWQAPAFAYVWNNRLYVIGRQLVTMDISDPTHPKVLSSTPFSDAFASQDSLPAWSGFGDRPFRQNQPDDNLRLTLPPIPDLPPQQRLIVRLRINGGGDSCFDGQSLCLVNERVNAFRLIKLTDKTAEFKPIGQYQASILQTAFGRFRYSDPQLVNGLLYVIDRGWNTPLNPHLTVFDIRGDHTIRMVGHFAAPGATTIHVLPDGRVLVGGTSLWLVGLPPDVK